MTTTTEAARAQMVAMTTALKKHALEREDVIDGMAAAMVAGEHVLLIGDPGTAKSLLAEAFAGAIDGRYFANLGHRYQQPDEMLGPWDMKALQADNRWVRRTARRLPEADVAFLDEVFKNSAALLNTLLMLINERRFENDGRMDVVPLRLLVGASNELPDERDGLGAFYDRFLLRYEIKRMSRAENVKSVLFGSTSPPPVPTVAIEALDVLRDAAKTVGVDSAVQSSVLAIRDELDAAGVRVSDRRWRKVVALMRARAVLAGDAVVTSRHLPSIVDCCWSRPEEREQVANIVRKNVASWVRDIMLADQSIDEQLARATDAAQKTGRRTDSITTMANVLDVAIDIESTIAGLRVREPSAASECERVSARIEQLKRAVQTGMSAQGIQV